MLERCFRCGFLVLGACGLILAGGLLLLTPGLITDIIGFAALIPLTRHFFKIYLKRAIHQRLHSDAVQADYKIN